MRAPQTYRLAHLRERERERRDWIEIFHVWYTVVTLEIIKGARHLIQKTDIHIGFEVTDCL